MVGECNDEAHKKYDMTTAPARWFHTISDYSTDHNARSRFRADRKTLDDVGWRRPINSIGRSPSRLERNEINLLVAGQLSYIHCYVEALLRWRWLCWRQPILGYLYSSDSFVPVSSGRATILLLLSGHLKALPPPTLLYYFFSFVNLCPCYTPSISSTQSPWV